MSPIEIIGVAIVGYLIGSVSFAVLIARSQGVNIFKTGSGNPGATNVKRVLGQRTGNLCFALDALKGFIAAGWPQLSVFGASDPGSLAIVGLLAAILGHNYSVFLRFQGGKGVSTAMGGLLAVMPLVLLLGLIVWTGVFIASRYVSVASLAFAVSLPLWSALPGAAPGQFWVSLILAAIIISRHHTNIRRLLRGTETRWSK